MKNGQFAPTDRKSSPFLSFLAFFQGGYYLVTGIWPIVHIGSFMAVTGPKVDLWLVRTVAVLVLASGFVFLSSALRKNMAVEVVLLAILNGLGLAAIDLTYVSIGRISPVYLGDALIEIILCVAYGIAWVSARAVPTETVSRG